MLVKSVALCEVLRTVPCTEQALSHYELYPFLSYFLNGQWFGWGQILYLSHLLLYSVSPHIVDTHEIFIARSSYYLSSSHTSASYGMLAVDWKLSRR